MHPHTPHGYRSEVMRLTPALHERQINSAFGELLQLPPN